MTAVEDTSTSQVRLYCVRSRQDLPEAEEGFRYSAKIWNFTLFVCSHRVMNPKTKSGGTTVALEGGSRATYWGKSRYCETPLMAVVALVGRKREQYKHRLRDAIGVSREIDMLVRSADLAQQPALPSIGQVELEGLKRLRTGDY